MLKERKRFRWGMGAVALLTGASLAVAGPASATTTTLAPASLTTTTGSIGSGQTVANLAVKDLSGTTDNWNKYVEFIGNYDGYRTYTLPSSVPPSSVTSIQVSVNYRGPATAQQTWTWSLYNWSTSSWTSVGTNASAPSWGSWKLLTFTASSGASAFVNPSGSIRVRLKSNNSADSTDIDYESLLVTSSGSGSTPTIPLPPAAGKFSYQLGGSYTPETGVQVVVRDSQSTPAGSSYYNICYVNLLQTQPDEAGLPDSQQPPMSRGWYRYKYGSDALILKDSGGNPVGDAVWNEWLLDVRTAAKRTALFEIQKEFFDSCKNKGFQAIEPDNLDSDTRSDGLMTFTQTKEYLKLVVPYVHSLGMAIAQKNTSAPSPEGYGGIGKTFVDTVTPAQGFDFAVAEACARWVECDTYTSVYGDGYVFEIEYTNDNPNRTRNGVTKTVYQWACQDKGATMSIILRDVEVVPNGTSGYHYEAC